MLERVLRYGPMRPENAAKSRPRHELAVRVLMPLVRPLVRLFVAWRVNPQHIVLAHTLLGGVAAGVLASGNPDMLWLVAVLLWLKTVLDNTDGGVARASGQVTGMGRYLDTVMDFWVNVALFLALTVYGLPGVSLAALVLLTLILSLDFNHERLYKSLRHPAPEAAVPVGAPLWLYRVFEGFYRRVFTPQDQLIAAFDRWFFRRVTGLTFDDAPPAYQLAWHDLFATASLVNLGLSSQYLLFSLLLAAGQPFWYPLSVFVQFAYVVCVQLLRALRFHHYRRTVTQHA
jgi:archaetidylinositol phosphate synthase